MIDNKAQFPKMVYRDGKHSSNPDDYRVAHDAEELSDLKAEGFTEYDASQKGATPEQKLQERRNKEAADAEAYHRHAARLEAEAEELKNRRAAAIAEQDRVAKLIGGSTPAPQGAGDSQPNTNSAIGGGINGQTIGDSEDYARDGTDGAGHQTLPGAPVLQSDSTAERTDGPTPAQVADGEAKAKAAEAKAKADAKAAKADKAAK